VDEAEEGLREVGEEKKKKWVGRERWIAGKRSMGGPCLSLSSPTPTHRLHRPLHAFPAPLSLLFQVRPIEEAFKFSHFFSPLMTESDFDAKPSVLLLGQYSTGKVGVDALWGCGRALVIERGPLNPGGVRV
jgi:hypothetical protein